jgi:hypothetical protein
VKTPQPQRRQVKLVYRDGHAEQREMPEPNPVEIFVAGSKCGKVRSMRFLFDEELTKREGVLVYVERRFETNE